MLEFYLLMLPALSPYHITSSSGCVSCMLSLLCYFEYVMVVNSIGSSDTTTTTVLRSFYRDHPGEPVLEENFWTLWCKGRLTEADTSTIQLGATSSGLISAHFHHPPMFFTGRMPFLPPKQQYQGTGSSDNC